MPRPARRWWRRGLGVGRRWPRVRRAATLRHPGRLVLGMATIPLATSAPRRQADPPSAMATRTRTGRAVRISPARARTSPARAKASSTPTAPGSAGVLAGRKRAAEHLDLGGVLGLVGLRTVQLGPRPRAG